MKQQLKRSRFVVAQARALRGIVADARTLAWLMQRGHFVRDYLSGEGPKMLHIGCGLTPLKGWLNTDIHAGRRNIVYLDATRTFPFPDNSFDYVFSEHMIEHIDFADARFMLGECQRVLRPGGRLRVATPELGALIDLHSAPRNNAQAHYLRWIVDNCLGDVTHNEATFVINNAFRAWGHRFLYDHETLRETLSRCGFEQLRNWAPGNSEDENLRGIESHGREIGDESINRFETQVWEGVAP